MLQVNGKYDTTSSWEEFGNLNKFYSETTSLESKTELSSKSLGGHNKYEKFVRPD